MLVNKSVHNNTVGVKPKVIRICEVATVIDVAVEYAMQP